MYPDRKAMLLLYLQKVLQAPPKRLKSETDEENHNTF